MRKLFVIFLFALLFSSCSIYYLENDIPKNVTLYHIHNQSLLMNCTEETLGQIVLLKPSNNTKDELQICIHSNHNITNYIWAKISIN